MKKELLTKLLLALVVTFAGISLHSCSDDDEPQTQIYTYGWDDIHASGSDLSYFAEMAVVENAFKAALGSASPITLNGTSSECDAKVKAACERAAESLKGYTWSFSARFDVTNETTGKVVYSLQFTKGSNLF